MKEQIINNIKELKEIIKETNLKIKKDDSILDFAVRLYQTDKIQSNKEKNMGNYAKTSKTSDSGAIVPQKQANNDGITEKQVEKLKKLGYTGNLNISKREAWSLIKGLVENGTESEY